MKKSLIAILLVVTFLMTTACGSNKPATPAPATETPASAESKEETPAPEESKSVEPSATEITFNYPIVENTSGKTIRIAVICVNNNPFWVDVVSGVEDVKKVMAEQYNCEVDLITVNDFDAQIFSDTIETCIVKEYDAITTVGVSDAIVPAIDKAVDAGIPVYLFNSDTEKDSKRTAFHGQDLYAAGGVAAQKLVELMEEEGKIAIITGLFSVNAHELRRTGAIEVFDKYPNIEVVGEVESHDSNDEAYGQTKDFLTAHPDLKGIYCTAAGQLGAAKALKEMGLENQVNLICFDYMAEVIDGIYDGSIKATIGQDPYGQGADPVIFAYNEQITGKTEHTGDIWTKMDVVDINNIQEFFPR